MPGRLGHAQRYDAAIHVQGGRRLWTRVDGLTTVEWGRTLDDYSEARIVIGKRNAGRACCEQLARIEPWGHELSIYRDRRLVWQGPVTVPDESRTEFEIPARDMIGWFDRRFNHRVYNYMPATDTNPGGQGERTPGWLLWVVLGDAFSVEQLSASPVVGGAEHDPGLWPYLHLDRDSISTRVGWQVPNRYSQTVGDAVRELIGHGFDMFTVGRDIYIWPEARARANTPHRLSTDDFLNGDATVRKLGLDMATRGGAVGAPEIGLDSNGAPLPDQTTKPTPTAIYPARGAAGAVQPFYGLVERTTTSMTATSESAVANLARRLRDSNWPRPLAVVLPTTEQLSPRAPITVDELVPARRVVVHTGSDYYTRAEQRMVISEVQAEVQLAQEAMTERIRVAFASEGTAMEAT